MNYTKLIGAKRVYSDFIDICKNFKSSVNLSYDVGSEEKVKNYILTSSLAECIEGYVDNVLNNTNNASYITGPYGKGKSYLFLILFYIFSPKKSKRIFDGFKSKASIFSRSLVEKLDYIENNKIYLLPVVVNANMNDSVQDCFITALKTSLEQNGIDDDLDIPTSYSLALKFIKTWEKDKDNEEIFEKCKREISLSIDELKTGLKSGRSEYLAVFKDLFSCVTHGVEFKSWYDESFAKVYFETATKIKSRFKGLFVVFDEFGAFLDTPNNMLVRDLNQIQSFAEMCKQGENATSILDEKKSVVHFALIAHKELDAYNRDKNLNNAFQTIKGRFQKYDFTRSFEDDFTSILSSIEITDKEAYSRENEHFVDFLASTKALGLFSESEYKILERRAFPFNPIALKCLVIISRSLGQNERTMFSFMGSNAGPTFLNFAQNHSSGLLNLDYVYDYFEDVLSLSNEYHELYIRLKSAFRMCKNDAEISVLKAFVLIKIASISSLINVNRQTIAFSLYNYAIDDFTAVSTAIQSLLDRGVLKESVIDKELDFLPLLSEEIQAKLAKTSGTLLKTENFLKFLSSVNSKKYYISNEYNFKYKMTRFFSVMFAPLSLLQNLDEYSSLLFEAKSDGLIINVYQDEENCTDAEINKIRKSIGTLPIILNPIKKLFTDNFKSKVQMLYRISKLLKSDIRLSESEKSSLETYEAVLKTEIQAFLSSLLRVSDKELCKVLENYYTSTIVFNNEQINRAVLTKTTTSSLSVVVDLILRSSEDEIKNYKATSQEYTIYKSFENAISTKNASLFVEELLLMFNDRANTVVQLIDIVNRALSSPYGARIGILPLFVAYAISRIASNDNLKTVFLYARTKDVGLTADNLIKAVQNSENYSLHFLSTGREKLECLDKLYSMFCPNSNTDLLSFNEKLYKVNEGVASFLFSLSPSVLHTTAKDNVLCISKNAILFKDIFTKNNLNAYEAIFVDLVKELYVDVLAMPVMVQKIKEEYTEKLSELYEIERQFVINTISEKATSIKASFELFYAEHKYIDDIVFEKDFLNVFSALKKCSYSDRDALNLLSSEILNTTLDDWNVSRKEQFEKTIIGFADYVRNYKNEKKSTAVSGKVENVTLSALGKTFYNNLLSEVNEYGSALSNKEKVVALEMLLKEIRGL